MDAKSFTVDVDVQIIHTKLMEIKTAISKYTNNTELLEDFEKLMEPIENYNKTHFEVRKFFESCSKCTGEEISLKLHDILADYDGDKFIAYLKEMKDKIGVYPVKILSSLK